MKKTILLFVILATSVTVFAQPSPVFPKTITVNGSAELEIIPDEIYVNVDLREYQKKGESKKDLEQIKTQFLQSCMAAGIPDSCISIANYSGFNNYYYWRRKKNTTDLFATITYQVKFRNTILMDHLIERLDDDATQNFIVVKTSHSKITEFRKQLKIKAIQAAKDKGIYLTEAISEKLGEAVTIVEPEEPVQPPVPYFPRGVNGVLSNENVKFRDEADDKVQEIDFKKIKLRYEVAVTFALK
jgi:uncharacterized protein YggE